MKDWYVNGETYAGAMSADLLAHPAKLNAVMIETQRRTGGPLPKKPQFCRHPTISRGGARGWGELCSPLCLGCHTRANGESSPAFANVGGAVSVIKARGRPTRAALFVSCLLS